MSSDPARPVFEQLIAAMGWAFGTDDVKFFAGGDNAASSAFEAHYAEVGCDGLFLWVRAMQRYRSETFPTPTTAVNACDLPRVIAVELGVARCAIVEQQPSWAEYRAEALATLDDSFRLESAVCRAAGLLRGDGYAVGSDTIAPDGPEGGVISWTAVAYVQFD